MTTNKLHVLQVDSFSPLAHRLFVNHWQMHCRRWVENKDLLVEVDAVLSRWKAASMLITTVSQINRWRARQVVYIERLSTVEPADSEMHLRCPITIVIRSIYYSCGGSYRQSKSSTECCIISERVLLEWGPSSWQKQHAITCQKEDNDSTIIIICTCLEGSYWGITYTEQHSSSSFSLLFM